MNNNDRLVRLRYALDIKDTDMVEIFKLGGLEITKEDVKTLVKNSFEYSLLSDDEKQKYLIQVENFE